jgi:Ca-activated chloride channel family protein
VVAVRRLSAFAIVAVLVVSLRSMDGQDLGSGAQRPAFRSGVDVIAMSVTVTDGSRRYVTDLNQPDFHILEDGRPQQVTFFQKSSLPLALALLIDTSASMELNLAVAQEAAIGFVRELSPVDVASLIDFDTRVQVLQGFTSDQAALEAAIRKTAAGGSTALYNAVYIALKELNKTVLDETLAQSRRRAIVILSDGEDTSSLVAYDEVLALAARSDVAIYAIGLLGREASGVRRPNEAQFVLRRFAEQTGGRAFFPADAKELAGIYGDIKAELASQYFLAYESNNPRRDGQFRRIAVRVEREGALARARPGYYAPTR